MPVLVGYTSFPRKRESPFNVPPNDEIPAFAGMTGGTGMTGEVGMTDDWKRFHPRIESKFGITNNMLDLKHFT